MSVASPHCTVLHRVVPRRLETILSMQQIGKVRQEGLHLSAVFFITCVYVHRQVQSVGSQHQQSRTDYTSIRVCITMSSNRPFSRPWYVCSYVFKALRLGHPTLSYKGPYCLSYNTHIMSLTGAVVVSHLYQMVAMFTEDLYTICMQDKQALDQYPHTELQKLTLSTTCTIGKTEGGRGRRQKGGEEGRRGRKGGQEGEQAKKAAAVNIKGEWIPWPNGGTYDILRSQCITAIRRPDGSHVH